MKFYNDSLVVALRDIYPNFTWFPNGFPKPIEVPGTPREYLEWAGTQLGVKQMSDWYKVKPEVYNSGKILRNFQEFVKLTNAKQFVSRKNSFANFIMNTFSEVEWLPWGFSSKSLLNQQVLEKFLAWTSEKLGIETLDDWYLVSPDVNQVLNKILIIFRL